MKEYLKDFASLLCLIACFAVWLPLLYLLTSA